jgi:hypothetical protein
MKKYLNSINKGISLLMIILLLIQQFGCTTTNSITSSNLTISPKYLYKIYYHKSVYELKEPQITNGILSGKISIEESMKSGNIAYIYPVSDSAVRINPAKTLSIPLDKISQVKVEELAKGQTAALVICSFLAAIIIIGATTTRDLVHL